MKTRLKYITGMIEKEYDENGNLIYDCQYEWDRDLSIFVGELKYEYEYDSSFNVIQKREFAWDEWLNVWISGTRRDYLYDRSCFMF